MITLDTLPDDIIEKISENLNISELYEFSKVLKCVKQIKYYNNLLHNVDWEKISYREKLSEDFIREFQDKVNWTAISYNQELSEDFIREFQDKVNWKFISMKQELSKNFVREFRDIVDWDKIYSKSFFERLILFNEFDGF